jgi:predicted ArsR family transcriptional regulator
MTAGAGSTPGGSHVPPPLTEARRDVLYAVRRRGEATVEEIADALGMTVSGARQHVAALADAGLVTGRDIPRQGRGRPRTVHRVTPLGDEVFPKAYGELTNELLGYLDADAQRVLFDRRAEARVERAEARLAGLDLPERVDELARILDEDGYLASSRRNDDGTFDIIERNCAIATVAAAHPDACRSELDFIRAVLPEATVDRLAHMVAGATECGYRVVPVSRSSASTG